MATHSSVVGLENPRDGGAWWAVVSGVTQSRTRLKQLSSNSSSGPVRKSLPALRIQGLQLLLLLLLSRFSRVQLCATP